MKYKSRISRGLGCLIIRLVIASVFIGMPALLNNWNYPEQELSLYGYLLAWFIFVYFVGIEVRGEVEIDKKYMLVKGLFYGIQRIELCEVRKIARSKLRGELSLYGIDKERKIYLVFCMFSKQDQIDILRELHMNVKHASRGEAP